MDKSFTYTRISGTAAGTTVISDAACELNGVFIGQNKTGTVTLYDVATAGGSAATNFIADIQNTCGTIPAGPKINAYTHSGLIAVKGGTTDMVVIWG